MLKFTHLWVHHLKQSNRIEIQLAVLDSIVIICFIHFVQKPCSLGFLSIHVTLFHSQGGDDNANTRLILRRAADEPHIGKYRLIKTIGKGNFAKVKLAKHVPTGREVSVLQWLY